MDTELEIIRKRVEQLEKKIEIYYELLTIQNELDFIMRGSYLLDDDINDILDGNY